MAKKRAKRGKKILTDRTVEAALLKCRGNYAAAAKALGVTRQAVSKYVKERPELLEAVNDQREARIDRAESALDKAIDRGAPWAISLTLRTQGKERGWVERQEVTGKNGTPIHPPRDLSKLSDTDLATLEAILERATPHADPSAGGEVPALTG